MDKEKILHLSRNENSITDERERFIELKGSDFSTGVLVMLSFILTRLEAMKGLPRIAILFLTSATLFSNCLYQLIKVKTKTTVFFTIAMLVLLCIYGYQFFGAII